MKLLYVPLNPSELQALQTIARAERRRPQEQAAVLLVQALAQIMSPSDLDESDSSASAWMQLPLFENSDDADEVDG